MIQISDGLGEELGVEEVTSIPLLEVSVELARRSEQINSVLSLVFFQINNFFVNV